MTFRREKAYICFPVDSKEEIGNLRQEIKITDILRFFFILYHFLNFLTYELGRMNLLCVEI